MTPDFLHRGTEPGKLLLVGRIGHHTLTLQAGDGAVEWLCDSGGTFSIVGIATVAI